MAQTMLYTVRAVYGKPENGFVATVRNQAGKVVSQFPRFHSEKVAHRVAQWYIKTLNTRAKAL
jgi:hypothetical protein